jgi:hypothetical protein
MPYLHWETDKHRRTMVQVMEQSTAKNYSPQRISRPRQTRSERDPRDAIKDFNAIFGFPSPPETVLGGTSRKLLQPRCKLGKYLLDVARVYDALNIERDVRLLADRLHESPPLHPRRTLYQSYHSKIENNKGRSYVESVYRKTEKVTELTMVDQLWLYVLDDRKCLYFHCPLYLKP